MVFANSYCSFTFDVVVVAELLFHLYSESTSSKIQLQETKPMLQAAEVERDRLIELSELLQKRYFLIDERLSYFYSPYCDKYYIYLYILDLQKKVLPIVCFGKAKTFNHSNDFNLGTK